MSVQVRKGYYLSEKYAPLERFISYYYQIDAIRRAKPERVLFVGVGDGIVPTFLKRGGIEVTTLDFDPTLAPDVVGDIRSLPFPDASFDLTCAFEVLEHLPFAESRQAMAELARTSKRTVLISVPHRRTGIEVVLKFPGIRTLAKREFIDLALRVPIRFPGFAVSKQHYWEIDGRTTRLKAVRDALSEHLDITRETTPVLDPYRRFFELRKRA